MTNTAIDINCETGEVSDPRPLTIAEQNVLRDAISFGDREVESHKIKEIAIDQIRVAAETNTTLAALAVVLGILPA